MVTREDVSEVINGSIAEVNELRAEDEQISTAIDAALFGENGSLDSLGMVNLIVSLEEKVEERFGTTIMLSDESLWNNVDSPFQTLNKLSEHIQTVLTSDV